MMRRVVPLTLALTWMVAGSGPALAQGQSSGAEIKKQMSEISRLMRESERLLLEMTQIDKIIEQQRRVVAELEKLKPPRGEQPEGDAQAETEKQRTEQQKAEEAKRRELREKQAELRRKLEDLFRNQDAASRLSVTRIEELLRNLPSGGGGGGSGQGQLKKKVPGRKKDPKSKEQTQNDPKKGKKKSGKKPRDPKSRSEQQKREEQKKRSEQSQIARIDAWMARLPPAQLERISRNDFSGFPPRYRRLLREYTRLRAKREAEEERSER